MAKSLTVLVAMGSVRRERLASRVARFVQSRMEARGWRALVADPQALDLPMLDRMWKEFAPGEAPEGLRRLAEMIAQADAVVPVTAEYNHGVPPALKNLLDHFLEEWFFRPSGIVCYSAGRFGGVRAAVQLRPILGELGMPSISSILPIPQAGEALSETGELRNARLDKAAEKFLDELGWWAEAARARKAAAGTPF